MQVHGVRGAWLVAELAAVTEGMLGKIVVVVHVGGGGPHENAAVNHFAHGVQVAAFLQVQHLPTHQDWGARVAGCLEGTEHGIGFDGDVIVHVQDVGGLLCGCLSGAVGATHGLIHDAGVSARTAEVTLLVHEQPTFEMLRSIGEAWFVGGVFGALVGHDDGVDHGVDKRVTAQCVQCRHCIGRPVERWDAHSDARLERANLAAVRHDLRCGGLGCEPARAGDGHICFCGDVEPQPAAVLKRGKRQLKLNHTVADHAAVNTDAGTVNLGTIHLDPGFPQGLHLQHHCVQLGPAAPVTRGEGVEVGLEAHLAASGNGYRCPVVPRGTGLIRFHFQQIQGTHIMRFPASWQQYTLQLLHSLGVRELPSEAPFVEDPDDSCAFVIELSLSCGYLL